MASGPLKTVRDPGPSTIVLQREAVSRGDIRHNIQSADSNTIVFYHGST